MIKAFLDSSVLFTAVNSPIGGSAKLFILEQIIFLTSTFVLTEVERNVRQKLLDYHLERFFWLAKKLEISTLSINKVKLQEAQKVIVKKDAYILAQAKEIKPNYLLTLDKKHFLTQKAKLFIAPTKIVTPKTFLAIF